VSVGGIGGAAGVHDIIALRQQIIDRSSLLQQLHAPEATTAAQPGTTPGSSFTGALQNALHQVSATQNNADSVTDAYQRGETTDVSKVMLAREQSSVAFEATLQVKSRLLNAYQDIMRMGV
jgi:flagellar hook-basal body complex protein FliE